MQPIDKKFNFKNENLGHTETVAEETQMYSSH